ncbi:MAG: hypothetical protein H7A25_15795 [Leptospiraceae bacterium]|nr:hypothetical protein [Leptospiraceae bacterium]
MRVTRFWLAYSQKDYIPAQVQAIFDEKVYESFPCKPKNLSLICLLQAKRELLINLKRKNIKLPISSTKSEKIENPLENLMSYSQLLIWSQNKNITAFQSQLLAYSDKLLIEQNKSPYELRERRLFAAVLDKKDNKLHHIIFNFSSNHNLFDAAREVYSMLKIRKKKIEFIINLDVGSYNILEIYNLPKTSYSNLKGTINIKKATNLVVWEY